MKTKFLLTFAFALTVLSGYNFLSAQTPNLGAAANFVLFSSVGAIGNTAISQVTGNVGSNSGAITGFGNVNGVMHNADAATAQAVADLQVAWYYLNTLTPTSVHGPVLGNGETLYAGVDTIAAAGSIVGILNLDAQGNPNAVFVIKTGGALTTAASATINLINGAMACNVFWVAEGAISMATLTTMRGTLIAHNGAIDMGDGGTIEGRALSTTGAVSVYGTLAYIPIGCGTTILAGPSAPALGVAACYSIFSSKGVVSNSGVASVVGDIGTNQDITTGYNPALVIGIVHLTPDSYTAQCAADLQIVYTNLSALPYDIELLYPAQFGNELTLTPHTYRMNAAAILTGTLYLDAQGNSNAVFVMQIIGALSTSTYSTVKLINGTQAKNVYWLVEGAASLNDNSIFSGTLVCHNGAIILNTGVSIDGRALTTAGSINTTTITANNPYSGNCSIVLPAELLSFTGSCDKENVELKWSAASETNDDYYTVERSAEGKIWQAVGTVEVARNWSLTHNYSLTDRQSGGAIAYYKLKQTAFDGSSKFGFVIAVEKCGIDLSQTLRLYPNPSSGRFDVFFLGDKDRVNSIEIFSSGGEKVYGSKGFQSKFDLSNKTPGVYSVRFHIDSKTMSRKIVIGKL